MTVSRVSSLSEVIYENITEVRYKILIELEIKYVLQETFEQGVLMRGHGFSSLNGSKKITYDIVKKEEGYVLRSDDILQRISFETIMYSAAKIHFEEPRDRQPVFSQHFATYLDFKEIIKSSLNFFTIEVLKAFFGILTFISSLQVSFGLLQVEPS